jgi:hypothetical protein
MQPGNHRLSVTNRTAQRHQQMGQKPWWTAREKSAALTTSQSSSMCRTRRPILWSSHRSSMVGGWWYVRSYNLTIYSARQTTLYVALSLIGTPTQLL